MPEAITYTEARQNFASVMDRACDNHEPIIVTRQKSRPVVLMSLEDYNAMAETAYLLSTPANAERLMASIREADAGLARERELVHPE
jgi:antitoxin YefM